MNNEKGTARTKPNVRIVRDFGRVVPDKVIRRLARYYSIIEPSRDSPLSPCSLHRLVHPTKRLLL